MARTSGAASAFDIRTVIALLFAIYGVVLTIVGVTSGEVDKSGGININLYSGIGMLVFAVALFAWARLRPIALPGEDEAAES